MSEPMTLEEAASVLGHVARQYEAFRRLREAVEAVLAAPRAVQQAREELAALERTIAERRAELARLIAGIDELRSGVEQIAS